MRRSIFIFILFTPLFSLQAQEVISSGGAFSDTGDLKVSWTIGEVLTESLSGERVDLSQGQQQPILQLVNAINENSPPYSVYVHPNPTKDLLSVSFEGGENRKITVFLYNTMGLILKEKEKVTHQLSFSMADYPPGIYFIMIEEDHQVAKTFKVIKL